MSNREMLENALKRVNAHLGTNGKLYHDNTGWYVIWKGASHLSESAGSAGELLAYLHGIEDAFIFIKSKQEVAEQFQNKCITNKEK